MREEGYHPVVRLGAFVARIHEQNGVPVETVRDELLAATRKAAADVLGPQPRIEAVWNDEQGLVELKQVLTAVERVTQPYRELAVADLHALGGSFRGVAAGEEMELSVLHRDEDAAQAAELDAMFGGRLTLSCFQRSLDAPLHDAWIGVIHAHLPPRTSPPGSAGALFQQGGWLAGSSGTSDGVTLTVAKTRWKERPVTPDDAVIAFGVELTIERHGRSLTVPMEVHTTLADASRWSSSPAPDARRAAVERELVAAAKKLAGETSIDSLAGDPFVQQLLRQILGV